MEFLPTAPKGREPQPNLQAGDRGPKPPSAGVSRLHPCASSHGHRLTGLRLVF